MTSTPISLGIPVAYGPRTWVQFERSALEALDGLTQRSPNAARVIQRLVSMMGHQNAVVISQETLAQMMNIHVRTVMRALKLLADENWIQIVRFGARNTVNAYVVNANVAWGESRDQIGRLSVFTATVIASSNDQDAQTLSNRELRKLPIIYPPEEVLPHGDGEPGAQIAFPGMEPVIVGNR